MKKLFVLLSILALAVLIFPPVAPVRAAPGDISVTSNTFENGFPRQITFRLEAKSSSEIKKVTLYYKSGGSSVLSYAYPTITPGTSVSAQYSLDTQKMYIPPSTEISYQWQIDDAAGNSLKTDFATFNYDDIRFTWYKLTREGVTIYWYKGSQQTASDLLDAASAAIKRLSSEIGITYERPMKILVYDSKADMDPAIPKRSDTYSQETVTLGVRLSADVLALLGSQNGVKETLAHELNHMVVHQMVDNPYGEIPAWLDEGLSMLAEGDLPSGYQRALDNGIRNDNLISVRSMSSYSGDPGQVNLFYGESYSVVKFLIDSQGRDKMVQLLKTFKEGNLADDALQSTYGFKTDQLDADWRASLGLAPRSNQGTTTGPNSTPVPTMVPYGQAGRSTFDGRIVLACLAFLLCTVVLLAVAVAAFFIIRSQRR